eukprot:CAMPEP_0197233348 /NCGR_PEP_ID=MMETSP1429-20130617/1423_1 /TAXON_ID=49237 /ORGANISM="Chaetoceros  sp., Strain UNC1202" /LENGTH=213 /DNA_ID=CAMNT_0042691573 /DNA_START=30 /DNA_END=671 /DNA_ORIENTATION=+
MTQMTILILSFLATCSSISAFSIHQQIPLPPSAASQTYHRTRNTILNSATEANRDKDSTDTPEGSTSEPVNVASKFFQLEEKEDKETCTTEIFLSSDGTVTLSETDGPPPLRATGTWSQKDGDFDTHGQQFQMTIKRMFGGGLENTDVGEFTFEVVRHFVGEVGMVGNVISIDGAIHVTDYPLGVTEVLEDVEAGYFSMIDTTDAKLGSEEDV